MDSFARFHSSDLNTLPIKILLSFCFLYVLSGCVPETQPIQDPNRSRESVVLLHGLIRSSISMTRIADRLQSEGYSVYNMNYPAREIPIDEIVDELHEKLKICCHPGTGKLHFVTHSMGGIVVRAYIAKYHPENIGRVVMMGPPNQGTELADLLKDNVLVGFIFGPAVSELGTTPESIPNKLGPVDFELGIITGNQSWNPIGSWVIPGPDDGTVSVKRAQLDSMKDFLVVPNTHTFIMIDADVIDEVVFFLQHGEFMSLESGE